MSKVRTEIARLVLSGLALALGANAAAQWTCVRGDYKLTWDLQSDAAELVQVSSGRSVWHGPMLPGLWLQTASGERRFVKAEADTSSGEPASKGGTLALRLPGAGRGSLRFSAEQWGVRFEELRVTWDAAPPAIVGLYFGSAALNEEERSIVPSLDLPFWPRWSGCSTWRR